MMPLDPNEGKKPRKGTALIVAMAVVLMLSAMATVLMNEMQTRSRHVEVDLEDIKAFEAAEAGIDAAISDINRTPMLELITSTGAMVKSPDGRPVRVHHPLVRTENGKNVKAGCLGTAAWRPPVGTNRMDDVLPLSPPANGYIPRPTWQTVGVQSGSQTIFHDPNITPQQLGDVAFFTFAIDWLWDGIDNDGHARPSVYFAPAGSWTNSAAYTYEDTTAASVNSGKDKNGNGVVACIEDAGRLRVVDMNEIDIGERNKYTIYSTGIHKGLTKNGATQEGRVVTIEVVVQAADVDLPLIDTGPLQLQIRPRSLPPP